MVHLKQLATEPDSRQAMFLLSAWSISNSWPESQTVDRPWERQKEEGKATSMVHLEQLVTEPDSRQAMYVVSMVHLEQLVREPDSG